MVNTYTYVNGDPVNLSDPSGHDPCGNCNGQVSSSGDETGGGGGSCAQLCTNPGNHNNPKGYTPNTSGNGKSSGCGSKGCPLPQANQPPWAAAGATGTPSQAFLPGAMGAALGVDEGVGTTCAVTAEIPGADVVTCGGAAVVAAGATTVGGVITLIVWLNSQGQPARAVQCSSSPGAAFACPEPGFAAVPSAGPANGRPAPQAPPSSYPTPTPPRPWSQAPPEGLTVLVRN